MVLQRQVPARPTAKTGDGFTGPDAGRDGRNDGFSAALSNEKRSAAAEQDKVETKNQTDAEVAEPDDQGMQDDAQSDEILNLLAGLMSSASYSETAALGDDATADKLDPDAVLAQGNAGASEPNTDEPVASALVRPDIPVTNGADDAQPNSTKKPVRGNAAPAETKQLAAEVDQPAPNATNAPNATVAGGAKASENPAAQLSATPGSADVASAAVLSAAAGMAGKGTQASARSTASDTGPDRQKDPSVLKEALQALGLERGSKTAASENAETPVRARTAAKQGGIADRQVDEHPGLKQGKVEVIESRRFMPAQTMSANAQSLTRSLAEAGGAALAAQRAAPVQSIAQTGQPQAGQTLHTLKLQLNPVSLGSVTAVLKLSGDELSVEIKVETAEAYRQLKDDNQSILKALRGQGFGVEQITVQHVAGGSDRSSGQSSQQGFQANQQGAGSSDAQSSGRENGRNSAGQQGSSHQGGQGHEQGSYTGPGAGRTDGVYL